MLQPQSRSSSFITNLFSRPSYLLALLLALIFGFYLRGLGGDFIFDDLNNIEFNPRTQIHDLSWASLRMAWGSGVASDIGRPLSMLSFALNYFFAEHNVWWYKFTNVVIHLLTTIAIYYLSKSIIQAGQRQRSPASLTSSTLALFVAASWALHPLHASTVLYVVQRMTQLAALFTCLALLSYCRFRLLATPTPRQLLAALLLIAVMLGLAMLSKETGALGVPLMLLVEFCFFRWRVTNAQQRRFLQIFTSVFVVLPAVAAIAFISVKSNYLLDSYQYRNFTLGERLLTESRVLWDYIGWVLTPNTGDYTFFHDNYPISHTLLAPLSTLFAIGGLLLLIILVLLGRKRLPWLSFGVGFFLISHLLESTFIPLELVFEHRNYLPAFGLLFGLIVSVFDSGLPMLSKKMASIFCGFFVILVAQGLWQENSKWADTPTFLLTLEQLLPTSQRVQYNLGYMYLKVGERFHQQDYLHQAQLHFQNSTLLDERQFDGLIGMVLAYNLLDEDIPQQAQEELSQRIRSLPINTGGIMNFISLTRCYLSQQCKHQPEILINTYRAIAANTQMATPAKQVVLSEIASDILITQQRVDDALGLLYFDETLSPELTVIDLRIIVLEIEKGNFLKAREHFNKAKQKAFASEGLQKGLQDIEKQLNKLPVENN